MTDIIEIRFPIVGGGAIPRDHRYILYSAIKHRIDGYGGENGLRWQLFPVGGVPQGDLLELRSDRDYFVRLRLPKDKVGKCLKISEEPLRLGNHILVLGDATVHPLKPSPVLYSDLVIVTSDRNEWGVKGKEYGMHIGKRLGAYLGRLDFGVKIGKRKHTYIAGAKISGHPVTVMGLTDSESIKLQSEGLAESRSIGCGVFEPKK